VSVATDASGARPRPQDVQATRCAVIVDEWARGGVRRAVLCPGSRSAPLALALARHGGIDVDVRLDERSAGFYALGAAIESGRPVVVCTTSGTAAAELHAAVVEAHHARVPLVVCTADRPPELHDVAAPQTIDQAGIFGRAVRFAVDLGVADWEARASWRGVASRIVAEAVAGPTGPGPVHVNVALREPLLGTVVDAPPGRPGGAPWHRVTPSGSSGVVGRAGPDGAGVGGWVGRVVGRRGVVVAGAGAGQPDDVFALADALGWPVLADPLSGCRVRRPGVVGAADGIVRSPEAVRRLGPDVVVRLGAPWASRALATWTESLGTGVDHVVVDPWWRWPDPARLAGEVVVADPGAWCRALSAAVTAGDARARAVTGWRGAWERVEAAAWAAVGTWCAEAAGVSEPGLARVVAESVPAGGLLVVSSSMPVREVEWFVEPSASPPRTVANRGANGIDGVVSTALGAAAAGTPVVALVGDLAFLHDLTALVRPAGAEPDCTVVVADNGGGGIFSFLPQATALAGDEFERLFATAQAVDAAAAAAGLGVAVDDVDDIAGLRRALAEATSRRGILVVRVRLPDREKNVALHDELFGALGAAVDGVVRTLPPWR
jgi:2-succinyl-5-enolpyruvyl-6-hydroxy-3-cyclohexene-1-carboxylate synthase